MLLLKLTLIALWLLTPEKKHRVEIRIVIPPVEWIEPIMEEGGQAI